MKGKAVRWGRGGMRDRDVTRGRGVIKERGVRS